ncbi:hypothetical protein ACFPPD_22215 [Cohnella suwonensis]|uniref:Transcriptional regulator n=1 Tax=Cohnella suwonensis TaxID=696072 RepID=A0ABW0M070_9BACL
MKHTPPAPIYGVGGVLFIKEAIDLFEEEFEVLLKKQLSEARGQRREMLDRDLSGTKKMLEVIYSVIGSLRDIVLEYEMVTLSGVKIYGDAFIRPLGLVLEEENYITHAETITRKRFSFERARIRSVAALGYSFFPYSRDELEQHPEQCRREFQEIVNTKANQDSMEFLTLPVYEREILRFALMRSVPFYLSDSSLWLNLKKETSRKVLRSLEEKKLIVAIGGGQNRCHGFRISDKAIMLFHRR